ncbi:Beta/Gamma crystallin [compost metagenome]
MRLGRGSWEVCEDANYRGRCEVINGDVSNLGRSGMNDKISSLRPARRGGNW